MSGKATKARMSHRRLGVFVALRVINLLKTKGAGSRTPPQCWVDRRLVTGGGLGLEFPLQPRQALHIRELLEDLELSVGLGLADVDGLGEVHVLLRLHRATGTIEANSA